MLKVLVFFCLLLCFLTCNADRNPRYSEGDEVEVLVNTIGPYYNPSETYPYYHMPVCKPEKVERKTSLGGKLDGDRLVNSLYKISFLEPVKQQPICNGGGKRLSPTDIKVMVEAIEQLYFFEFRVGQFKVSSFLGSIDGGSMFPHAHEVFLYRHYLFTLHYNQDQIVHVNLTASGVDRFKLPEPNDEDVEDTVVDFLYSVEWVETDVSFENRKVLSGRVENSLRAHWLSIMYNMVLVVFLTGFVALILLKVVRSDLVRYSRDEEDGEGLQDDHGWKMINGDVFRPPPNKNLFCAILGNGSQFLCISTILLFMSLLKQFGTHRHGYINYVLVMAYAFTSLISGMVSANFYKQIGGDRWVWNILTTNLLFVGPLFLVWSVLNSIAWYYGSTQALNVSIILLLFALWLFLGFPLTVMGGILGKNMATAFDVPCRTKVIPREIPSLPWHRSRLSYLLVGGFLPFIAISIELYHVFLTLWGRHLYTLYGILTIVFFILLIVTSCVSIFLTYFLLALEDYRWWWSSICNVGFTGVFIFVYSIFYFCGWSEMTGTLQGAQFFGYTLLLSYITFLMLGFVGFYSSLRFVKYIYGTVKMD